MDNWVYVSISGAYRADLTLHRLIMIPLAFLRRLDSLKYTSIIALVSIGYLIILVLAHFIKGDTKRTGGDLRIIHWAGASHALTSFPVIVFAYTCHQNVRHHLLKQLDMTNLLRCFPFSMKYRTILTSELQPL